MTERTLKVTDLDESTQSAAWAAYRTGTITWLDDDNGHIATIGTTKIPLAAVKAERVLTIDHADLLGELIRGVQRNRKLVYYPFGSDSADNPARYVMRAFTKEGGDLYFGGDVRDAYVWCSGFMEQWFLVSNLIMALDNLDGKHGLDKPIATIEGE